MEIRTVVTWIFGILSAAGLVAVAENYKQWLKRSGGNTLLVRVVDKILPTQLQKRLSWQYLHTAWWCWTIFGLGGGIVLTLWLTPFLTNLQTKWLLASDETTIKAVVPDKMFQEWKMRQRNEAAINDQLNELGAEQAEHRVDASTYSMKFNSLETKIRTAINERVESERQIEQYVAKQLADGKWRARGIPNEAPPHDNDQIVIKPAQWQYLQFTLYGGAIDPNRGPGAAFKGVEISRPKGQE